MCRGVAWKASQNLFFFADLNLLVVGLKQVVVVVRASCLHPELQLKMLYQILIDIQHLISN